MALNPLLRERLRPPQAASLCLLAAALILASVWVFQASGYEPCELCLKQRYFFYAALPLATAAVVFARAGRPGVARGMLALLAVLFAGSAIFGFYHAGVEWKLWPGPTDCTGDFVKPATMEDFRKQLQHVHVVRCDEPALKILGLSLAFWNFVASSALSLFAGLAARSKA
jgi:disulfide bond formation protein DsbB